VLGYSYQEEGMSMPDYAAMYKRLFNSQTTAIEILQQAQQDTENMYIEAPEPTLTVLERKEPDEDE